MIDFRRFFEGVVGVSIILVVNHFVFHQRPVSNLQLVFYFGVYGVLYLLAGLLQRRKGWIKDGWHYLTPGLTDWFGVVAGIGLASAFIYVYHFVGSARWDAASQMLAVKILIVAFSALGAFVFFFSFMVSTRWNDRCIERRYPFNITRTVHFKDIVIIDFEEWSKNLVVIGGDGTQLRIPTYQNGIESLLEQIAKGGGELPVETQGSP